MLRKVLDEFFGVNPAWITYGVEPMRSMATYTTRYCNFMQVVEAAESDTTLPTLLETIKLTVQRLDALRASPSRKISDTVARRCEKHLGRPKGWLDQRRTDSEYCEPMPPDLRALVDIYIRLTSKDQRKLHEMAVTLLNDTTEA